MDISQRAFENPGQRFSILYGLRPGTTYANATFSKKYSKIRYGRTGATGVHKNGAFSDHPAGNQ